MLIAVMGGDMLAELKHPLGLTLAFQAMLRNELRVKATWNRIMADESLSVTGSDMEKTWDNVKKLIPKSVWMEQIYSMEAEYLDKHPESGYMTEILTLKTFPDYIDYLPEGAIVRKIGVMGYYPQVASGFDEYIAISREEYLTFVKNTVRLVVIQFKDKGLL